MTSTKRDWADIQSEIDRLAGDASGSFNANIIGNARDLMGLVKGRCPCGRFALSGVRRGGPAPMAPPLQQAALPPVVPPPPAVVPPKGELPAWRRR